MSFFADQGQSSGTREKHENQQQQSPDTVFAPRIAPPAPPPSADSSPAQSLGATPYQTNRPIYTIAREPRPLDRFGQPLLRSSMFQPSLPGQRQSMDGYGRAPDGYGSESTAGGLSPATEPTRGLTPDGSPSMQPRDPGSCPPTFRLGPGGGPRRHNTG